MRAWRGYLPPLNPIQTFTFTFPNSPCQAAYIPKMVRSANPLAIQPPLLAPLLLSIMILICASSPLFKRSLLLLTQTELFLQPSQRAALLLNFLAVLRHHCHVRHDAHAHCAGCSSTAPNIGRRGRGTKAEVRRGRVRVEVIYVCGGCGPGSLKGRVWRGLDGTEKLLIGAGRGHEVTGQRRR